MPTIIAGLIAGSVFLALRFLNVLPTVRMILMFIMSCGLAVMIGGLFLMVWGWVGDAATGFLPWQVGAAFAAIPTGIMIYCLIVCGFHLKPKAKPSNHVIWAAFAIPLCALLVTGGIVGTVGDKLTSGVTQGANRVSSQLVGTGGSGPLPAKAGH